MTGWRMVRDRVRRRWDWQTLCPLNSRFIRPSSTMSAASTSSQSLLEELDARQDEILAQLEELNARIERVLKECLPAKVPQLRLAGE